MKEMGCLWCFPNGPTVAPSNALSGCPSSVSLPPYLAPFALPTLRLSFPPYPPLSASFVSACWASSASFRAAGGCGLSGAAASYQKCAGNVRKHPTLHRARTHTRNEAAVGGRGRGRASGAELRGKRGQSLVAGGFLGPVVRSVVADTCSVRSC